MKQACDAIHDICMKKEDDVSVGSHAEERLPLGWHIRVGIITPVLAYIHRHDRAMLAYTRGHDSTYVRMYA